MTTRNDDQTWNSATSGSERALFEGPFALQTSYTAMTSRLVIVLKGRVIASAFGPPSSPSSVPARIPRKAAGFFAGIGSLRMLVMVARPEDHRTLATGPIIGSRLGRHRQQLSGVHRWRRYFNGHLSHAELGQCEGNNLLILFQDSFTALNRSQLPALMVLADLQPE